MIPSATASQHASMPLIELCATLIIVGLSFCFPRLSGSKFRQLEQGFGKLARNKTFSVIAVGAAAFFLRLAILPLFPMPLPFVPDDFSFLLSADTFAHGRLFNPTPAMWMHFETIHVTMQPSYTSMYFPGQGLVLAAGQALFGHPWIGLLIVNALMCAAICWMLQAWLPSSWALLGGLLSVLHLGLFSYWINTYHAAGGICALGGALILGALPRLIKTMALRDGLLMALGIALLLLTRPYEGLLLCLPVAWTLGRWAFFSEKKPQGSLLLRRAAIPVMLIVIAGAWLAYYDYRAFGKATTLPYTVDRAEYALAPYYVWQSPRPEPAYRHAVMRDFYHAGELEFYSKIHNVKGFVPQTLLKISWTVFFYAGFALLLPLFFLRRAMLDKRMRFLGLCIAVMVPGMLIQIFLLPHYLAAYTAIFYAFGLQAMRHMRQWKPEGKPVGLTLARLCITLCVALAGLRVVAEPLGVMLPAWPVINWNFMWYGPGLNGTERDQVAYELNHQPGKHLVLVRYSSKHNPFKEWVYNDAVIDNAKVIWAREMDGNKNDELLSYYKDRHVWLIEPDANVVKLLPYQQSTARPSANLIAASR